MPFGALRLGEVGPSKLIEDREETPNALWGIKTDGERNARHHRRNREETPNALWGIKTHRAQIESRTWKKGEETPNALWGIKTKSNHTAYTYFVGRERKHPMPFGALRLEGVATLARVCNRERKHPMPFGALRHRYPSLSVSWYQ